MAFHDVRFPTNISRLSQGGPGFWTQFIPLPSGVVHKVARWSRPRHKYNIKYGIRSQEDAYEVLGFYIARGGPQNTFRLKDYNDYSTGADGQGTPTSGDVAIGTGDASVTQFQMLKKYEVGSYERTRVLRKIVSGTMVVAIGGADQPTGWSVSLTTGIITFDVAPGNGLSVSAGCEFDVPVSFGEETDEVFLTTWITYEAKDIPDIMLEEDIAESIVPEDDTVTDAPYPDSRYPGGGTYHGALEADYDLSYDDGKIQVFVPGGSDRKLFLPVATDLPNGGEHFVIVNGSGSFELDIVTAGDSAVTSVPTNSTREFMLVEDSGDVKTWYTVY